MFGDNLPLLQAVRLQTTVLRPHFGRISPHQISDKPLTRRATASPEYYFNCFFLPDQIQYNREVRVKITLNREQYPIQFGDQKRTLGWPPCGAISDVLITSPRRHGSRRITKAQLFQTTSRFRRRLPPPGVQPKVANVSQTR